MFEFTMRDMPRARCASCAGENMPLDAALMMRKRNDYVTIADRDDADGDEPLMMICYVDDDYVVADYCRDAYTPRDYAR